MHDFSDFYLETYGVWKVCEQPNRTPDFKSPKTASKYWDCGDYVIRKSNHWGVVGSCFWRLDGFPRKNVLNLGNQECAMIYYKDLGTARQEKQPPKIKQRFKMLQPDLHHEGPVTSKVVDDLLKKLETALNEIKEYEPVFDETFSPQEWSLCKANWAEVISYAGLRCSTIFAKAKHEVEISEDDRKCIDITLCILRDFDDAKEKQFTKPLPI